MTLFNVLIVDDEQEFRDMTIKRLNKRNLQCEGAENGEKALERVLMGSTAERVVKKAPCPVLVFNPFI